MSRVRVEIDMTTLAGKKRWAQAYPASRFIDEDRRHWIDEGYEHNSTGVMMDILPTGTLVYSPDPINRVTLQFPDQDSAIIFFEWCLKVGHAERVV